MSITLTRGVSTYNIYAPTTSTTAFATITITSILRGTSPRICSTIDRASFAGHSSCLLRWSALVGALKFIFLSPPPTPPSPYYLDRGQPLRSHRATHNELANYLCRSRRSSSSRKEKRRVGTTTIGHYGLHINSISAGLCLCKRNQLLGTKTRHKLTEWFVWMWGIRWLDRGCVVHVVVGVQSFQGDFSGCCDFYCHFIRKTFGSLPLYELFEQWHAQEGHLLSASDFFCLYIQYPPSTPLGQLLIIYPLSITTAIIPRRWPLVDEPVIQTAIAPCVLLVKCDKIPTYYCTCKSAFLPRHSLGLMEAKIPVCIKVTGWLNPGHMTRIVVRRRRIKQWTAIKWIL